MQIIIDRKNWDFFSNSSFEGYFIGYLFHEKNLIINAEQLVNSISECNKSYLFDFFNKSNGNFAAIFKVNQTFYLISDIQKTYPLFIIHLDQGKILCDNLSKVAFEKKLDWDAAEEFVASGWVYGNKTIYNGVTALQPGEILSIEGHNIESLRYFKFLYDPFLKNNKTDHQLFNELGTIFNNVFTRLVKSKPEVGNWIVPLSGGHDSRIIVNYLHKLDQRNVICFTYGNPGNPQSTISEQVAKSAGYEWYFVEYTEKAWAEVHKNGLFDQFIDESFNGSTLPHFQDFLAIYLLKQRGHINDRDIVVPGHTAITEAAKYELDDLATTESVLDYVQKAYASIWPEKVGSHKIRTALNEMILDNNLEIFTFPEFYNWQERQAKFISNSVRVYEFFGLGWRLPFWEKDVADFWLSVDFTRRIKRDILLRADLEYLLNEQLRKIPFTDKWNKKQNYSRSIISKIPVPIRNLFLQIFKTNVKMAEGLNYIYALRAKSINDLISPLDDIPDEIKEYFASFLKRSPRHLNNHSVTILHTLARQIH